MLFAEAHDDRGGGQPSIALCRYSSDDSSQTTLVGAAARLLAWSEDGRYVAYAVPAPSPAGGTAASSYEDGRPILDLAVLDLNTEVSTRYPPIRPVLAAAFAPNGRLAAQVRQQAWVVTVRGTVQGRVTLPAGQDLAGPAAWSLDGTLLATTAPARLSSRVGSDGSLEFVSVPGAHRPIPAPVAADRLLGWRSPDRVLINARRRIDDVDLSGRSARTVSRLPDHGDQACQLRLVTGLVRQATFRAATDPDRGTLPMWPLLAVAVAVVIVVVVAVVVGLGGLSRYLPRRRHPSISMNAATRGGSR